jgi:hypothetical protein
MRALVLMGLLWITLAACGGDEPGTPGEDSDGASQDMLAEPQPEVSPEAQPEVTDAAPDQAETVDVGPGDVPEPDLAGGDAGIEPLDGFGGLDGACGILDDEEWSSDAPFFFVNRVDFGDDPYDDEDLALLSEGGQAIVEAGNAGGNSLMSEVFAYEVLYRCEAAALLKTETEITYMNPQGKITDLLVGLDEQKIGVSVTRAVAWPFDEPYPPETASALLEKKLQGVLDSSANVAAEDAWVRQILHVMAYTPQHAEELEIAWGALPDALKADTIVIVTVTDGDDGFLY